MATHNFDHIIFKNSPFVKKQHTPEELANIQAYNNLRPRLVGKISSTTQSTCYPSNYDGELDDEQPTEQDWSDFANACEEQDSSNIR
jgi:hypothetical protein